DDIRQRLEQIEKMLSKMQPTQQRTSGYAGGPNSGRVSLVNAYSEEILFIVNGTKSYRLAPNASMQLDGVPAGALSYQIMSNSWGVGAARTTPLAAGETLTLTAVPQ